MKFDRDRPGLEIISSTSLMRSLQVEISNAIQGGCYTANVFIGAHRLPMHLIVDTGSSSLVVEGKTYTRSADPDRLPTHLAQAISYGAGWWAGCLVRTSVSLRDSGEEFVLQNVHVAATLQESEHGFGKADGILGLAYRSLDTAYDLGRPTWPSFDPALLESSRQTNVVPYFTQLEESGCVANCFSLITRRSRMRIGPDPAADPINMGILIFGNDERIDRSRGSVQAARVMADVYFNTNVKGLRVGDRPLIQVEPPPQSSSVDSNSFVDSGLDAILLPSALDGQLHEQFEDLNPEFAKAIDRARESGSTKIDDLPRWPSITAVLEGVSADVVLQIEPETYWQTEAAPTGEAVFVIETSDDIEQTILGLPLLNNYLCTFDRSANGGTGAILFAPAVRSLRDISV